MNLSNVPICCTRLTLAAASCSWSPLASGSVNTTPCRQRQHSAHCLTVCWLGQFLCSGRAYFASSCKSPSIEVLRKKGGNIVGISVSAIRFDFRKTVGAILFPVMKFMHRHGTELIDTWHLVIAVNPKKIELSESLLFFERLQDQVVNRYGFASGAPAVGASLDLKYAGAQFCNAYMKRKPKDNLYNYFLLAF